MANQHSRENPPDLVEEAGCQSFPASDPPAWGPVRVGAPPAPGTQVDEAGKPMAGRVIRTTLILVLTLLGAPSAHAADPAAGQVTFRTACGACHATQPGKNGLGPPLFAVVGRKAGTVAGYNYSAANKNSELTWMPETLDKFLEAPKSVIPGTKMVYAGLKDATKRADLIAYLENLK